MKQIVADKNISQCSYYFTFYLVEALKKAGLGDLYLNTLAPWEELLQKGLTTFVEPLDPTLIDPYKNMDIEIRPDLLDGTPEEIKKHKETYRNYMAMVTACDQSVGRLIDILKEKGELENTLIVFTSDHGDVLKSFDASKPKQYPHDYSCRVPLIMNWEEGLRTHRTSDLLIGSMDLMPTILGLLEIDVPEAVQGQDLSNEVIYQGKVWHGQVMPLGDASGTVVGHLILWYDHTEDHSFLVDLIKKVVIQYRLVNHFSIKHLQPTSQDFLTPESLKGKKKQQVSTRNFTIE